jgi:hypothetical protein
LNRSLKQWTRVPVYMPITARAQRGAYDMSITGEGDGRQDITYDSVAFVPLPGKPAEQLVVLGDSYASGEGAGNYLPETDDSGTSSSAFRNGCHRARNAWLRQAVLPDMDESVGALADRLDPTMDYRLLACSSAPATPMQEAQPRIIGIEVRSSVETVLRQVRARAENGRLVAMGYPRLFPLVGDGMDWYRNIGCMVTAGALRWAVSRFHPGLDVLAGNASGWLQVGDHRRVGAWTW